MYKAARCHGSPSLLLTRLRSSFLNMLSLSHFLLPRRLLKTALGGSSLKSARVRTDIAGELTPKMRTLLAALALAFLGGRPQSRLFRGHSPRPRIISKLSCFPSHDVGVHSTLPLQNREENTSALLIAVRHKRNLRLFVSFHRQKARSRQAFACFPLRQSSVCLPFPLCADAERPGGLCR